MENRLSVVFYRDWHKMMQSCDPSIKLALYDAIMGYAFEGKEPNEPAIALVFALIKQRIDADADKWADKREKRRAAGKLGNQKRWGNKSQDMANIANATDVSQTSQDMANIAVNVNGNGNVNVTPLSFSNEKSKVCVCEEKDTHTHTHTEIFLDLLKPYPRCQRLTPPTEAWIKQLLQDKARLNAFTEVCADMENKADLLDRYTLFGRTFNVFYRNMKR